MLKFFRLFTAAAGFILTLSIVGLVQADSTPSWLGIPELSLQRQAQVSTLPAAINGNIDCFQPDPNTCAVPTEYGSATFDGTAALNGSPAFHPVISYVDNHQHFLPVPNSDTVITYTTEPAYGFYLYFNYSFSSSISPVNPADPQYKIKNPPDAALTDANGHRLAADYGSMSFSQNGQWMVVSDPNLAMLRINLQTLQALPFAPGFNYTEGLTPNLQTAISNDGRYAVVASKNFSAFTIYDLDTCGPVPDSIGGAVGCQSRDLGSFIRQQQNGYINASNVRFIDDDSLSLYATYAQDSSTATAKFLLSDSVGNHSQLQYLALGDSYISGEGAFDYQAGTDTDDNHCHISQEAYPYLLGHDLNFDSYHSVACSGAVTDDIIDSSLDYSGQTSSKLKREDLSDNQIDGIKNNFSPGYIDQLNFVSTYQPEIVTLSIGGNDIGFSTKLRACLNVGTCYSTYEDRLEFVHEVNSKFNTLINTYTQIKNADAPDARIYVIGYPQIAKVGGDCADNVHMNNDELIFAQQAINYLDTVIQIAAAKAGVVYVDTQNALDGHRLCEASPGSVAMNGITAGKDAPNSSAGPFGNESYHPNALGHELLENAILAATHNLTDPMPIAVLSAMPPPEAGLDILNVPPSGRAVNITEYDSNLSGDVLFKQALNAVTILGPDHALAPATSLQAVLHSDVVPLGSFTADADGDILVQIIIPDSVAPGYHTLHLYGTDINDQPIDIYKVVYIADSPDDMDGDNISDNVEPCVGVPPSGHDYDLDGIDDSCDGTIDATQVEPPIDVAAQAVAQTNKPVNKSSSLTRVNTSSYKSGVGSDTTPKVLAAEITKKKTSATQGKELTVVASTQLPGSKQLIIAGCVCVWVVICYAAYKLRE